jgi:hypothetical protein
MMEKKGLSLPSDDVRYKLVYLAIILVSVLPGILLVVLNLIR